jgi:hypothetical protein
VIELIGILGGGLFAFGCFMVACKTVYSGRDTGTPLDTQWSLFLACALYAAYLYASFGSHLPFVFLVIEVICWGVALWYHYFPRKGKGREVSVVEMMAKAAWDDHGSCAPQCNAECDGACAEVYRTGKVL